jgi:hypothetical protein
LLFERCGTSGRRSIQRSLRAFDAWAGNSAEFHQIKGSAELELGQQILLGLHHGRWASSSSSGVFRSPLHVDFHTRIMRRLLELGALRLSWLSVRGQPVAVLYGMIWGNKVYAYQTGRSGPLHSPGD